MENILALFSEFAWQKLARAWRNEIFWHCEVHNSFLVHVVQNLPKSVKICKSHCKKFIWIAV